ncbi:MAG: DUF4040 domain-containing protein [Armatimonadia bacterium]|nr:DUF4040 domain-containing protein [Armatimonadia bacterium]
MAIQVLNWVALGLVLLLAVLAVHMRDLLKGALALALMSAVLAAMFYHFGAPWAAMFELSVCAGFITVLFLAVIALTEGREQHE